MGGWLTHLLTILSSTMTRLTPLSFLCLVGLVILSAAPLTPTSAQPTHYFPGSNINYTGGSNSYPLNSSLRNKCQWLYLSSDFNSIPSGPFMITTIYFKPSRSRSNQSISSFTIKLKNTTLTTLSSGSWVSGMTTVYGPTTATITTTANSWKAITLSTPFLYTGGNLIFEMSHSGSSTGISINQYNVSGRNGRKYGSRTSSSSAGVDRATALFGFDGVPASCSGTPGVPSITTAPMTTASPICSGGTKALAAFDPNAPLTNLAYSWQQSSSSTGPWANVSSGSGATTTNYTTGALTASTWFRFGVKCNVSGITTYSSPYLVRVGAAQPGAISGRSGACPGDQATFSVPAVPGHTYTWTLPTGWTGSSTTNSITVTMGNSGTISVTATGCGGTSVARTKAIVPGNPPPKPGTISGKALVCAGTAQKYKVLAVPTAQSYVWTLPNGWSGTSSVDSITTLAGTSGGTIQVTAVNGCGTSSARTKTVSVINSLASPGTITSSAGSGPYCAGQLYTLSITAVPGATTHVWTLPTGWSGSSNGTSIQVYAGSSGQISVRGYVACATSPAATLNVTVNSTVNPSVSVAPNSTPVCSGQPTTLVATPTNGGSNPIYQWWKNGSVLIASGSSYTTTSLANGDNISVQMVSNAACRSTDTVTSSAYQVSLTPSVTPGISINSTPVVKICAGALMTFSTRINGPGDNPAFQWYRNGVAIAGADDTSLSTSSIIDGDTFTVVMKSDAVCRTDSMAYSNKVAVDVEQNVVPTISVSASTTEAEKPVTFTANQTGGGSNPVYQWILNNVEVAGATGPNYSSPGLRAGDRVKVRLQSDARCALPSVVVSDEIIMTNPASIAVLEGWQGTLSVFPNPSSGQFEIAASWPARFVGKQVRIEVFSLVGQSVFEGTLRPSATEWKYSVHLNEALPVGSYLLRLSTQDGMQARMPIVVYH